MIFVWITCDCFGEATPRSPPRGKGGRGEWGRTRHAGTSGGNGKGGAPENIQMGNHVRGVNIWHVSGVGGARVRARARHTRHAERGGWGRPPRRYELVASYAANTMPVRRAVASARMAGSRSFKQPRNLYLAFFSPCGAPFW